MGEMTEFSYEQHGAWNGVLEEDLAFVVLVGIWGVGLMP